METSKQQLINECSGLIAEKGLTIGFAESATAGKLIYEFSRTEHSGDILKGSLVCYNACIKEHVLGISKELIETYTPESAEVTKEMAQRLKTIINADITVAVTGLTAPGGSEQPGKPVGTMFYCILLSDTVLERRKVFSGAPEEIVDLTIDQIAKTLIMALTH